MFVKVLFLLDTHIVKVSYKIMLISLIMTQNILFAALVEFKSFVSTVNGLKQFLL